MSLRSQIFQLQTKSLNSWSKDWLVLLESNHKKKEIWHLEKAMVDRNRGSLCQQEETQSLEMTNKSFWELDQAVALHLDYQLVVVKLKETMEIKQIDLEVVDMILKLQMQDSSIESHKLHQLCLGTLTLTQISQEKNHQQVDQINQKWKLTWTDWWLHHLWRLWVMPHKMDVCKQSQHIHCWLLVLIMSIRHKWEDRMCQSKEYIHQLTSQAWNKFIHTHLWDTVKQEIA